MSLNLSFLYFFSEVWVFEICVWVSWKLRPSETNKEKRFKLVSILLSKLFYGHAMFIGGNSQKGSRYLSFPVYRCRVLWIQNTEFNLNNIIATLSLISISSVKKFAGKCPQTWSQLRSMNAKGEHWHSELGGLDVTISARYDWSVAIDLFPTPSLESQESYLTTGMFPYKHSRFFPQYARLYKADASPVSRLRSAGLVGNN